MPLSKINSNSFSSTANTNIANGTLFIDAVNGRVGAGTTAPISQFHAKGAGSGTFGPYNDPLVVEGSSYTYLHLKSANNQAGVLFNRGGSTGWFHGLDNSGNLKYQYMSEISGTGVTNAKDGTSALSINSSNLVTMPNQPSFFVFLTNAQTVSAGGQRVNFDTVRTNIASGWNSGSYRFTAPVAGSYQFNAVVSFNNLSSTAELQFYKNGGAVAGKYDTQSGTCGQTLCVTFLLAANDYIEVYTYSGASRTYTGRSDAWTSFSGYLIG